LLHQEIISVVPHADMRRVLKSPGSAGSLLDIVKLLAGEPADEGVWDADTALKWAKPYQVRPEPPASECVSLFRASTRTRAQTVARSP
jgi:hypothetical protein